MTALALTEDMKKEIVQKASSLIARASLPKGLLSTRDIATIIGFPERGSVFLNMLQDPKFPPPVYIGEREKRWYASEIFHFIDNRRRSQI